MPLQVQAKPWILFSGRVSWVSKIISLIVVLSSWEMERIIDFEKINGWVIPYYQLNIHPYIISFDIKNVLVIDFFLKLH
jgi:hypothetical protein